MLPPGFVCAGNVAILQKGTTCVGVLLSQGFSMRRLARKVCTTALQTLSETASKFLKVDL